MEESPDCNLGTIDVFDPAIGHDPLDITAGDLIESTDEDDLEDGVSDLLQQPWEDPREWYDETLEEEELERLQQVRLDPLLHEDPTLMIASVNPPFTGLWKYLTFTGGGGIWPPPTLSQSERVLGGSK